jgi:hypothetical protein
MLAEQVSRVPAYAGYPWFFFGGFISERFMVCVLHGAFTAAALVNVHRGVGRLAAGVLAAMGLHYLGNFPIYVASLDPWGWGKTTWQLALSGWVAVYFIFGLVFLGTLAYGRHGAGRLFFGRARCPECGAVYPRPMWGFNLVTKRYERCPVCNKWHLTTTYREERPPPCPPT